MSVFVSYGVFANLLSIADGDLPAAAIRIVDLHDEPADLSLLDRPLVGVLPVEQHRLVVDRGAAGAGRCRGP